MNNQKFQIGDKVKILVNTVPIGYDKRPYHVPKDDIRVVIGYNRSFYDQSLVYELNPIFHDVSGIGFRENEIEKV